MEIGITKIMRRIRIWDNLVFISSNKQQEEGQQKECEFLSSFRHARELNRGYYVKGALAVTAKFNISFFHTQIFAYFNPFELF